MHVIVTRLFDAGRPIPRWRQARLQGLAGLLASDQVRIDRVARPIPCLRLIGAERVSIELLEPRFARILGDAITFAGYEIGGSGADQYLAQTWMVQFDAVTR